MKRAAEHDGMWYKERWSSVGRSQPAEKVRYEAGLGSLVTYVNAI